MRQIVAKLTKENCFMGFFGKKTESLPAEDLIEVRGTGKGLTAKEMRELKKKMDGKVSKTGDIRAGLSDLKNGRNSSKGVGPAPKPRKGKSMWS
jgi:hypothetical protein